MIMITIMIMMMMIIIRINKFFEVDFAIKVNASNERRLDRSTAIPKPGARTKSHVQIQQKRQKYVHTNNRQQE